MPNPTEVFHNFTADGNSSAIEWAGGQGHFAVFGTFSSGTAKLQYSLIGDEEAGYKDVDTTDLSFTADGHGNFTLPPCHLRVNLSSATTPDLDVFLRKV